MKEKKLFRNRALQNTFLREFKRETTELKILNIRFFFKKRSKNGYK
jgi:hypothetical protein